MGRHSQTMDSSLLGAPAKTRTSRCAAISIGVNVVLATIGFAAIASSSFGGNLAAAQTFAAVRPMAANRLGRQQMNMGINRMASGARFQQQPRFAPVRAELDQKIEGATIEEFLVDAEPKLQKAIFGMFSACKEVGYKIRTASCDKQACFNAFGDEQLAIDVLADTVIFENLKASGAVATASSEEEPTEVPMGGEGYSVAFDPLDGSSVIDTNFAVGTIWGTWPGDRLVGVTGRQLKSAGIAVYGPRTTITLAVDNMDHAHEFLLVDDDGPMNGQWIKTNEFRSINEGKLIAPGNLRATQDNEGYMALFNYWLENQYQLRYTGGMVPDVNQMMVKGKGVFVNSPNTKSKLRTLYEVAPIGYLIEKAGGKSSDGEKSVLDIMIEQTEQTSQVCYGSA